MALVQSSVRSFGFVLLFVVGCCCLSIRNRMRENQIYNSRFTMASSEFYTALIYGLVSDVTIYILKEIISTLSSSPSPSSSSSIGT